MRHEAWFTGLGFLAFIAVCLLAGWLGEKMHRPEDYYRGNHSYLQENCIDCDQP